MIAGNGKVGPSKVNPNSLVSGNQKKRSFCLIKMYFINDQSEAEEKAKVRYFHATKSCK